MDPSSRSPAPGPLLNAVLGGAPIVLYATDPDGVFTLSEGSALTLLGLSPGELVGRSIFDIYAAHPDLIENIRAGLRGEHRSWVQKIGNLYFDSRVEPAPDGGVHGVATDITSYKRGEQALRAAVHHYQRLVETSPYGIYALDVEGRFIEVNRAAADIMGHEPESLLGRSFHSFTLAEDVPEAEESLQRKLRGEVERTAVEVHLVRPDGELRLVDIQAVAIVDDGEVIGSHGTIKDITEEREREASMRLMIHVLENVRQGVSIVRDDDEVVFRNGAFYDLLGIDRDSPERDRVMGRDLVVGREAADQLHELHAALKGRGRWTGRVRHRRLSDGEILVVDLSVGRVVAADGRTVDFSVLDDATEMVAHERRLRRTERLATLGTLAGGVAHELNNPLAAVHGFAQLLVDAELEPDEREAAEMIAREASRAARIVSDFRRLLTLEERDTPFEAVDVNLLVEHVIKLRRYVLATRDVEIRAVTAPDLPPVRGDAGRIEQAVINLVINAEHAISENPDSAIIEIRTRLEGESVHISVEDNGPGIPEEVRDRLFDPFWTTKAPGHGIGLGLSIVHQVVSEHEGKIEVESPEGGGAAFTIILPAASGGETAPASAPKRGAKVSNASGHRILIVDDEPSIRMMLQRFLSRLGHTVQTASDGNEAWGAIDQVGADGFDLVITDLRMPGLDGPGLYARIRDQLPPMEPRVCFMTGDATGEEIAAIGARAERAVLLKPFDLGDLEEFVRTQLKSAAEASGRPPDSAAS